MMENLGHNLGLLQREEAILGLSERSLNKLKNPPQEWCKTANLFSSNPYPSLEKNGILYHSQRDPMREAKRVLQGEALKNKAHLVMLGAGLGYIFEQACIESDFKSLLLMETDLEMLFYFLIRKKYPHESLRNAFTIFFFAESEEGETKGEDPFELLLPYLRNKDVSSLGFYTHIPALKAYPEKYSLLRSRLERLLDKRRINQATLVKFQKLWNKNIILNLAQISKGDTLNNFLTHLNQPKTIIIAGAGPSLSEQLEVLKEYKGNYILFAVDTAYIPLLKTGILPDVTFSSDPQWLNHHYVLSGKVASSLWVLDPVVSHGISHWLDRHNCHTIWWDNPFYLDEYFRRVSRGEVAHGGSISTNAFDIAIRLRPENIILVGQDMAFTYQNAHCKGSVLEESVFLKTNRFQNMELHNYAQMNALPKIWVKTASGKMSPTNAKLKVYIDWFEDKARGIEHIRLVRADKQAVFINGFEHKPLADFFKEERDTKETCLENFLKHHLNPNKDKKDQGDIDQIINERLKKLEQEMVSLHRIYQKNRRLIQKYKQNPKEHFLKEIQSNDMDILGYKGTNQILSLNAQKTILKITESSAKKDPIESSLELYSAMTKTAEYFLYLLRKV